MTMTETAREFFEACETGKGWEVCSQFCTPEARWVLAFSLIDQLSLRGQSETGGK